jgi:predicted TIM-barrel fold metal-dependent hydrolase
VKSYGFIDSDSHVLEPSDLWEQYLEPKYRDQAPVTRTGYLVDEASNTLAFVNDVSVGGYDQPLGFYGKSVTMPNLGQIYDDYAQAGFPAKAYVEAMDKTGIDYMVLYPSAGLYTNQAPTLSAEVAAAYRRAYNNWLADFCSEGAGRLIGIGGIDLRDPDRAAEEAVRCVDKLGFRGVYINPSPVGPQPLWDPAMDRLWATVAELGVPVGVHVGAKNATDPFLYHYLPGLGSIQGIAAFIIGNMIACAGFIAGGVLERHPTLRVVHLESGAGWAAVWLYRLQARNQGGFKEIELPGLTMEPIEYWRRQCYISADPDDPGIRQVVDSIGDDNIVVATDFGHPEGRYFSKAVEEIESLRLPEEAQRKMMWDNAVKLYGIDV